MLDAAEMRFTVVPVERMLKYSSIDVIYAAIASDVCVNFVLMHIGP